MKIDGVSINARARDTVTIPKPKGKSITVEIEAYPFGFAIEEILPYPPPPVTGVRKRNGQVIRDTDNQPVLIRDEQDSEYRKRIDAIFWLRLAALFYYAVKPVGRIQFESVMDMDQEQEIADRPEQFFRKIYGELRENGFSAGDINIVCDGAQRLSNMLDGNVDDAMADFSPGENCPQASSPGSEPCSTESSEPSNASG